MPKLNYDKWAVLGEGDQGYVPGFGETDLDWMSCVPGDRAAGSKKKFIRMSVSWFVVDFWALCAEKAKPQFETAFSEETSLHLWHPLSGHGSLELKNWDLIFFQSRALWRHFSSVLALRSSSTMLNFFAWYCAFMDITKEKGCWNATAA